ncbi:MAG: nucleotidyltransferase family protein [Bacteroidota bacterium]
MSNSVHVLIVAAGSSKRMPNHIKQLLPWKKTTLLGNTIEQVAPLVDKIHVVLGAYADQIQATLSENVQVHINPNWENGMGTSIAFGVKELMEPNQNLEAVMVLVPDQPLIDSMHLNALKTAFFNHTSVNTVATDYGNNHKGVPAIFGSILFPRLTELNADFGAKHIIEENTESLLLVPGNGKEIDVDTYSSYQELVATIN